MTSPEPIHAFFTLIKIEKFEHVATFPYSSYQDASNAYHDHLNGVETGRRLDKAITGIEFFPDENALHSRHRELINTYLSQL